MDSELLEYLLKSEEDPTRSPVEAQLEQDSKARHRLDLLRRALAPLAADAESAPPPPGLHAKTIGLVAEQMCRPLPKAPARPADTPILQGPWWRRVDVLLAACLLIAIVGLAAPMVMRSHLDRSRSAQCQENLRTFHAALETYHDSHGSYPDTAAENPRHASGMVVPMLRKNGALKSKPAVCPGTRDPKPKDFSLDDLRAMDMTTFVSHAPDLNPGYAYSLGFKDGEKYRAPMHAANGEKSFTPLMADTGPCDGGPGNSANHGGQGQNVLYQDGHVKFMKTRTAGVKGDDIYLNKASLVAAGLDPLDAVLGCSAAKP